MEVVKNRAGQDRSITRLTHTKIRVMGDSLFTRVSKDESGQVQMFDFESGPIYNIGNTIRFEKMDWKINQINVEPVSIPNFHSIVLDITPIY